MDYMYADYTRNTRKKRKVRKRKLIAVCATSTAPLRELTCHSCLINPYVAIGGGGILLPRCTFYPVALKPLGIVTKAFVTFPEYMWANKCWKKFSDISTSISNMAAGKWTSN